MKFGEIAAMEGRVKEGGWVGGFALFPGVKLRVRGIGNPDYQRAITATRVKDGEELEPEEILRRDGVNLKATILLGWEGFDDMPYSDEAATEALKSGLFQNAVFTAASRVALEGKATAEAVAKN